MRVKQKRGLHFVRLLNWLSKVKIDLDKYMKNFSLASTKRNSNESRSRRVWFQIWHTPSNKSKTGESLSLRKYYDVNLDYMYRKDLIQNR